MYCLNIIPICHIYKSESHNSLKSTSETPANVLEPHDPSMYTLSMNLTFFHLQSFDTR